MYRGKQGKKVVFINSSFTQQLRKDSTEERIVEYILFNF